jgi:hypothetical protein
MKWADVWRWFLRIGWIWVGLMTGAASLILTIVGLSKDLATPGLLFWLSGFFCLMVAAFSVWLKMFHEVRELRQKVDSLLEVNLAFSEKDMRHGGQFQHYSTAVTNTSKTKTIKNCRVLWTSSAPTIDHMQITLHWSGRPNSDAPQGIDLGPGQTAVFDYLRIRDGRYEVVAAGDLKNGIVIPTRDYEIQLLATGEDVPYVTQTLVIKQAGTKNAAVFIKTGSETRRVWPKEGPHPVQPNPA